MIHNNLSHASTPLSYRRDIDGLRAIAILMVCIFHFQLFPIGDAGFIGVDVFFVISGFLITRIIVTGLEAGHFSLRDFYYRRIRRLYPALLVVLLAYLAIGYFRFLPALFDKLAAETFFSSIYAINIYLWQDVNYFGFHAHSRPLLHMWSLAVEEQFYLFYPLILIALYRLVSARSGAILMCLIALTLASFALGWFASGWKPQAAFYLLPTRAWELSAGGILALVLGRYDIPEVLARVAGPLAICVLAGALYIHHPNIAFPGWFAALPVLASILFILAGTAPSGWTVRALSVEPMVFFGKISYPLYLVHWPVKILLQDGLEEFTLGWRFVGFVISVLLAWAIYAFVETPIRTRRRLPSGRAFLAVAGAGQAIAIGAALMVIWTNGMPQRFSPDVQTVLEYRNDMAMEFDICRGFKADCLLGDAEADPAVMIIGDSHSLALSSAFDQWLASRNESAVFSFGHGCLPVVEAGRKNCMTQMEQAYAWAEQNPDIKTVVIASSWRQPYDEDRYVYSGRVITGAAGLKAFEDRLTLVVSRLRDAGKSVVLIKPMYWSRHHAPETMARQKAFGTDWELDITLEEYQNRFTHLFGLFGALSGPKVKSISLIDDLCASGTCSAEWQDGPVFVDSTHIGRRMQAYFATILDRELGPLL